MNGKYIVFVVAVARWSNKYRNQAQNHRANYPNKYQKKANTRKWKKKISWLKWNAICPQIDIHICNIIKKYTNESDQHVTTLRWHSNLSKSRALHTHMLLSMKCEHIFSQPLTSKATQSRIPTKTDGKAVWHMKNAFCTFLKWFKPFIFILKVKYFIHCVTLSSLASVHSLNWC